jgi:ubiquinone/menaquinone biosynthesis C-methylase UbiE/DNA-binding transcriptional ArsR family regulator
VYQNQAMPSMPSIVKILRVVADPNRLRILLLLRADELSVAELQEILVMGQSTLSTHLSQLKQAGLVEDRRTGKNILYRLTPIVVEPHSRAEKSAGQIPPEGENELSPGQAKRSPGKVAAQNSAPRRAAANVASPVDTQTPERRSFLSGLLDRAAAEIPEAATDKLELRRVLKKRQDKMRAFFDSVAGRLGRDYVPGKSWKSLAEALLRLMPPLVVADLGAGEGASALLLSQSAKRVIAVDSSAKMIDVGREQARRNAVTNIEFRLGDMEELPIAVGEVELAFFSQSLHHALHPARALEEAARILSPGGRIVILDLVRHRFEEARELYADEWLGFTESELESMLAAVGFVAIQTSVVDKDVDALQFQTLLAVATKVQ